jgi:hypothetical protein
MMRKTLTLMIALVACGLLGVLLASDASWAKPKKGNMWLLCKCTCRADDKNGNHHYGNRDGVWYTTSHDSCDVFPSCTADKLPGIATDCLGYQQSGLKTTKPPSTNTQ